MIPERIHVRPNVKPRYYCCHCGCNLLDDTDPKWKYCPICGKEIEWNLAKDVWPEEAKCGYCGKILVSYKQGKLEVDPDYIGSSLFCRECRAEMCAKTDCLHCKIGSFSNCQWAYLKRLGLARGLNNE